MLYLNGVQFTCLCQQDWPSKGDYYECWGHRIVNMIRMDCLRQMYIQHEIIKFYN